MLMKQGDYSHTLILMVIILYFMFSAYATSPQIGSPSVMYELLKEAAFKRPVDGNQNGSYMTLKSNFALVFGVIQLCSGSGTVFLDQAYWQRAIASRPTTAVRAYILGGLAWFAIPFGFATTLGLAAVALTDSPSFPTYPNGMSEAQITRYVSSDLVLLLWRQLLSFGTCLENKALAITALKLNICPRSDKLIPLSSIVAYLHPLPPRLYLGRVVLSPS